MNIIQFFRSVFKAVFGSATTREPIAPPQPVPPSPALVPFLENGRYGVKDAAGQIVLPPEYVYADDLQDGIMVVRLGANRHRLLGSDGAWRSDEIKRLELDKKMGKNFYFREGFARIRTYTPDIRFAYINDQGIPITGFDYALAYPFSEGLAAVYEVATGWAFINTAGQKVIKLGEVYAQSFQDGLAKIFPNNKSRFIDATGRVVISPTTQVVSDFKNGVAVFREVGKLGTIDKKGNIVIPALFDEFYDSWNDTFLFKLSGKWGLVDRVGRTLIPFEYDCLIPDDDLLYGKKKDKWGYIDPAGQVIIPFEFDEIYGYSAGLYWLKKANKWGCLDRACSVRIPFELDDVRGFSEGIAAVKKGSKWAYITQEGRYITDFVFCHGKEEDLSHEFVYPFKEGMSPVSTGHGKWGFIDRTGQVVIPLIYDEAHSFEHGTASVRLKPREYLFEIDRNGNEVN